MSHLPGTRAHRAPAAAALSIAALLTGCGGADTGATATSATATGASSPAATTESSPTTGGSESSGTQTIEVSAADFSFGLAEDTFSAGTYEITLTNQGGATHDLTVERDGQAVASSEQIPPGESSTFEVTLEAGEYVFYCSVGNHRSRGMEVAVQVTS